MTTRPPTVSLDLYDPMNPVVVLRLTRGAAQRLEEGGTVSPALRRDIDVALSSLRVSLEATAERMQEDADALYIRANNIRTWAG